METDNKIFNNTLVIVIIMLSIVVCSGVMYDISLIKENRRLLGINKELLSENKELLRENKDLVITIQREVIQLQDKLNYLEVKQSDSG